MAGKLNSLSVERAHRSGAQVLLGDGVGALEFLVATRYLGGYRPAQSANISNLAGRGSGTLSAVSHGI